MKLKLYAPFEVDLARIRIIAEISSGDQRYIKDVANLPFFTDGKWDITVDIDTGKIVGWPGGQTRDVNITVRDTGTYILIDRSGNEVARCNDYVPHCLVPGDDGDTIGITIDETGKIREWAPQVGRLAENPFEFRNGWILPGLDD